MSKLTRERIALVLFFVMVIAGALILISYFSTGRSWSVAATAVDDRVGQMEGYTAIVYSGVAEPQPKAALQDSANIEAARAQKVATEKETGLGLSMLTLATEVDSAKEGRVYVSEVRNLYEKRGADVLSLDLSNGASRYAIPQLFKVGDKSIGVFSIKERLSRLNLEEIIGGLREKGATNIVCITPRPALISSYDGIDVALVMQGDHEYSVQNAPEDATVVAKSPSTGSVGVILLTSNDIPSTKSVESL